MYIWKVKRLADDFRAEGVTERQQLYYLLIFMGISYMAADPYITKIIFDNSLNNLDLFYLPTCLVIVIVGTVLCFNVSQPTDSSVGFLPRYICLGVPVGVRIFVGLSVVMFSAFAINDFMVTIPVVDHYLQSEETTWGDFLIGIVLEVLYFWYLRVAIMWSYQKA